MKKILIKLLCLPVIAFGQDNIKVDSKFNFSKSNNYNAINNKKNSKKYYNIPLKFNFKKSVKEHKDSASSYIFYSQNKTTYSPFNKGLIHLLSKAMQNAKEDNSSIIKKTDDNK
jgi:hypothetical protein